MQTQNDSLMRYQLDVQTGIHEYVFYVANRQAVDLWIDQMTAIYDDIHPDKPVLILLDTRQSGTLPLSYGLTKGRQWVRSLKVHPPACVALVHGRDNPAISFAQAFFKTMRMGHLTTRWFDSASAHEEAVQWLRQCGASHTAQDQA